LTNLQETIRWAVE